MSEEIEKNAGEEENTSLITDILEEIDTENEPEVEEKQTETEDSDVQDKDTAEDIEEDSDSEEEADETTGITAKQAKDWDLPKEYVGKNLNDVLNALNKQKETKKENKDERMQEEIPDPVEDFDAYKKYISELSAAVNELKGLKNSPQIKEVESYVQKEKESRILDAIEKQLPDGVKAQDVLKDWGKDNIFEESDLDWYMSRPKKFVNDVVNFQIAKSTRDKTTKSRKEKGDLDIEKQQRTIRGNQSSASSLNSKQRNENNKGIASEIADDLSQIQEY